MAILYGVGLAIALLAGGTIGVFLASLHYQRIASQHREYEREIVEGADFYVALAALRRIESVSLADSEVSAA